MATAPAAEPAPTFGPVKKADRLVNLDFTRGMALLGILLVNSIVFFGPLAALSDPSYHARMSLADRAAALAVKVLCEGKFVSIFSMLFGYGLLSQLERADAAGRGAVGFAFRRLLPLSLFGLIHALLIWYGDILFFYSLQGYWLLLARRAKARTLLLIGGGLILFSTVLAVGLGSLGKLLMANAPPVAGAAEARGFEAVRLSQGNPSHPAWLAGEVAAYRDGPWRDAQLFRTLSWGFNWLATAFNLFWLSMGMMLVGGALWRVRFFAPEQRRLRWRVLLVFLPLGLAFEALSAWLLWPYPPANLRDLIQGSIVQEVGLMFLPFGYLALFATLAEALPGWLRTPVASAGQMSLTVYLSESLIATGLAYHWGFRLFGEVGSLAKVLISLAIWSSLAVLSALYLTRFRQGPMEWLWRRMEYGRAHSRASTIDQSSANISWPRNALDLA